MIWEAVFIVLALGSAALTAAVALASRRLETDVSARSLSRSS
jgi:hypothetical protein